MLVRPWALIRGWGAGGGRVANATPVIRHSGHLAFGAVTLVERTPLSSLLDDLVDDGRIVHVEAMVERIARHGDLARPLPDRVEAALGGLRLWSHQASAIDLARDGRSVVTGRWCW